MQIKLKQNMLDNFYMAIVMIKDEQCVDLYTNV